MNKIAIAPEREELKNSLNLQIAKLFIPLYNTVMQPLLKRRLRLKQVLIFFVHVYNGMSGLHHREPGMVGAA